MLLGADVRQQSPATYPGAVRVCFSTQLGEALETDANPSPRDGTPDNPCLRRDVLDHPCLDAYLPTWLYSAVSLGMYFQLE